MTDSTSSSEHPFRSSLALDCVYLLGIAFSLFAYTTKKPIGKDGKNGTRDRLDHLLFRRCLQ